MGRRSIDVAKLKALAGQNLSGATIAKMLGCSRSGVSRVCLRHNIVLSGGPREGWAYKKRPSHEVMNGLVSAKTRADIADEFGVCVGTVSTWVKFYGLKMTHRSPRKRPQTALRREPSFTCSPRAIERALVGVAR